MRLIDADELIKKFLVTSDGKRIPEIDTDGFHVTVNLSDIRRIIRKAPTFIVGFARCENCRFLVDCSDSIERAKQCGLVGCCMMSEDGYYFVRRGRRDETD
jgi:hypothetical protein